MFESNYADRARTLMTVDDAVAAVYQALEEGGFLDNTYVFYTSDHGYQYVLDWRRFVITAAVETKRVVHFACDSLGEFRFAAGKQHHYDHDTRTLFAVRGPGIPANSTVPLQGTLPRHHCCRCRRFRPKSSVLIDLAWSCEASGGGQ
jgi:arylsulfatase A-like enzyme